jgi:hypothetical protein
VPHSPPNMGVVNARSSGALHGTLLPGGPLCSACCVAGGLGNCERLWLPGLLPGAGRAHTGACQRPRAPLLGRVLAWVVCAPAGLWTSGAGTTRAGFAARSRLVYRAVSCAPSGGSAPPNPCQTEADCRSIGLLPVGWVLRGHHTCASLPAKPQGSCSGDMAVCAAAVEGPWTATRAPADCCDVCLRPGMRNVIPAGPRQGWAPAPSPLQAMGPPLTWPCPPGLGTRGKDANKQMPQQPAASRPGAVQHNVSSRQEQEPWRGKTGTGTRRCTAAAPSPQKNTLEEDYFFGVVALRAPGRKGASDGPDQDRE